MKQTLKINNRYIVFIRSEYSNGLHQDVYCVLDTNFNIVLATYTSYLSAETACKTLNLKGIVL